MALSYLFWEATIECNLSCRHCGSECRKGADDGRMTAAEVVGCFEQIQKRYDPATIDVAITGGEPLLRPDLFSVTDRLNSNGFRWGMVTNGTLLDAEACHDCVRTGMHSVSISLHGPREAHDPITKCLRSFDKAVSALATAARFGFDVVEAITCVHPGNIESLEDTEEVLLSLGIRYWRLINVFPIGRARGDDLLLSPKQYRALFDFIAVRRRRPYPIRITFGEDGCLPPDAPDVRDAEMRCKAGVSVAAILHNGDVIGCPSNHKSFVQGNVRETPFVDVWENEFRDYRDRSWMQGGLCGGCEVFSECRGGAFHLWNKANASPSFCLRKHLESVYDSCSETAEAGIQAGNRCVRPGLSG